MSHLTLEALARLLDEPAAEGERAHLAGCAACREELDALREQTDALAALPKMVPAPDAWPELRERLREDWLVGDPRPVHFWRRGGALRAAAGVTLFLAGGGLGYAVRGQAPADPLVAGSPSADAVAAVDDAAGPGDRDAPGPAETGLDLEQVEEAQEAFFSALDSYMAANSSEPSDPAARLAALDNIVLTTAEALNEAPADPVINSFYLTAMAQRNAMFRQMATSSNDPVF